MFTTACLRAVLLLVAACLSLGAIDARACSATAQDAFSVGNQAADSSCNYGSIQDAINAASCPAGTKIFINQSGDYTNQHLTITNKNVTLIGRPNTPKCSTAVAACGIMFPCPTAPLRTIDGSGTNGSVITVRGSSIVNIQYLTITGGKASSGGGIDYAGFGELNIDTSTISDNTAGNGGGIRFQGNGGVAAMYLNAHTLIISNSASGNGGGISLEGGNTSMTMNAPNTWIALNQATNGSGGGIYLAAATDANIGSPGYLGGGAIYANTAVNGGGIANFGGTVRLYTTDPMHPVAVDNNTAYNDGGGIFMVDANDYYANLCAADFRITNNIAKEGTGVFTDDDAGGFGTGIGFNTESPFGSCQFASYGSVPCDASQQCSIVRGNVAMDVKNGNAPTNGAALLINYGTRMSARNLDVRNNSGGYALRELGNTTFPAAYTDVHLVNCLFADNDVSAELVLASGSGTSHLNLDNCTFTHDTIGASRVIAANDTLALNRSIIAEGSNIDALAFTGNASNLSNEYNIADDAAGLAATPTNIQERATFVDVANGDYRLFYGLQGGTLVRSWGIDYAPPVGDSDIRGMPRDQAVAATPLFGVRDLGAYEMQGVSDRIFIGTFGDDVLLVQ